MNNVTNQPIDGLSNRLSMPTTVSYQKAAYKFSSLLIALVLFSILSGLLAIIFGDVTIVWIGGLIALVAGYILINRSRGKTYSFFASPTTITVNGESFETSRIAGIYLTAPYTSDQPIASHSNNSSTFIFVSGSIPFTVGTASTFAVAKGARAAVDGTQLMLPKT